MSASSSKTAPRSGSYRNSFLNNHECSRHDFEVSYLIGVQAARAASLLRIDVMESCSEVPSNV